MADADNQNETTAKKSKGNFRYFKTQIAALSVLVGYSEEGQHVAPKTVRFEPIEHPDEFGNAVREGFLKTDDSVAIKKCLDDYNCVEIEPEEYDKVMKLVNDPNKPNVKRSRL